MDFAQQLRSRREALGISRAELAKKLGVSLSAIGNYETGVSFPKGEVLLRLFDCLKTDPNTLFQDHYRQRRSVLNERETRLLDQYRSLSKVGQESVHAVVDALCSYRDDLEQMQTVEEESRVIPLYRSPAAAGYAAPVFGEDFDYLAVQDDVPKAAVFAVRIQGDSMSPWIPDDSIAYVNRDPLSAGDVGIFCVDGDMLCKQYYRDPLGIVYLFSLNRARSNADVVLPPDSGRSLTCFGRVMVKAPPLPGKG